MYTELYHSSAGGSPAVRSLAMVWPNDPSTYGIEDQFLWGEKLMILPILKKDVVEKQFYLPPGSLWYDYTNNDELLNAGKTDGLLNFEIPLNRIKVAVRGGTILFTHRTPKINTYETRKENFTLQIYQDENQKATGDIYIDDGESQINSDHTSSLVVADSSSGWLVLTPIVNDFKIGSLVDTLRIAGRNLAVSNITVNGALASVSISQLSANAVEVQGLSIDLNRRNEIQWN